MPELEVRRAAGVRYQDDTCVYFCVNIFLKIWKKHPVVVFSVWQRVLEHLATLHATDRAITGCTNSAFSLACSGALWVTGACMPQLGLRTQ